MLHVPLDQLLAADNASLALMHDTLSFALLLGTPDSPRPWAKEDKVTFVCPVPGYDRHFALLEQYGIEMASVEMRSDGPDMAAVRELVKDPSVKGMWLVPTYSNPTGETITEEVAQRLAEMDTAVPDFTILADDAYRVHHLTDDYPSPPNLLRLCAARRACAPPAVSHPDDASPQETAAAFRGRESPGRRD